MDKGKHKGWIVDEEKSNEFGLFAQYNDHDCGDREHEVYVKSDGCVEIEVCGAGSTDDDIAGKKISLHFCELDGFIQTLQELRDSAKKHFGEKWPDQ